jgi:hypothetical protein
LNLKIWGVDFVPTSFVLESKDIDVTLGIGLVKLAQGTHRHAEKSIRLTTQDGKELEYITEPVVRVKGVASSVKLNQLDVSQGTEVPVVNKFF